jgi:phage host-nuclease inhibitor protein Gam
MANRYKPEGTKVESLEDVELALTEIRNAENEIFKIDSAVDVQIAKIRDKAAKDGEKYRNSIQAAVAKVQAYADYNRDELFKKSKSVELENGTFGYRQSTKVSVKKATAELLHKLIEQKTEELKTETDRTIKAQLKEDIAKLEVCIKVEEKLQKKAIGELSDSDRLAIQAQKIVVDQFFCETKKEEVNQELLKKAV